MPNCLQRRYDVIMLCAVVYIKVKTDIKVEVCLFKKLCLSVKIYISTAY